MLLPEPDGPVTAVSFKGNRGFTDKHLKVLKPLTKLANLNLDSTQITDVGLEELRQFKDLAVLNLSSDVLGGPQITDAGRAILLAVLTTPGPGSGDTTSCKKQHEKTGELDDGFANNISPLKCWRAQELTDNWVYSLLPGVNSAIGPRWPEKPPG